MSQKSYESILNSYNAKKELQKKLKQKEQQQQEPSFTSSKHQNSTQTYMNFLEKQIDKANSAYQQVA